MVDDRKVSWWLLVIVLFGAPLLDSIVPVLPGEVVVAAGATAVFGAALPIPAVVAVAAAGSLVGECIVLALARRLAGTSRGSRLAGTNAGLRIGRFLDRWGLGAVVFARFLPGGRTAAAATFALGPSSVTGFVAAAAAGSLIWAGYLVGIGSGIGAVIF